MAGDLGDWTAGEGGTRPTGVREFMGVCTAYEKGPAGDRYDAETGVESCDEAGACQPRAAVVIEGSCCVLDTGRWDGMPCAACAAAEAEAEALGYGSAGPAAAGVVLPCLESGGGGGRGYSYCWCCCWCCCCCWGLMAEDVD